MILIGPSSQARESNKSNLEPVSQDNFVFMNIPPLLTLLV